MSSQSSGLKSTPNEKPVMTCCLFLAGFMHDFLFCPEDGGDTFLRNDTALDSRRQNSSKIILLNFNGPFPLVQILLRPTIFNLE
jgi:hypothetical protein